MLQKVLLKEFLAKLQASESVPEASLVDADFIEVTAADSMVGPDISSTDIGTSGNGYDQRPSVVGIEKGKFECKVFLRDYGTDVLPKINSLLRASRFDMTESGGHYIYALSNVNNQALTVWGYGGSLFTNNSVLHKVGNVKLDWNIEFDFTSSCVASMTFNGPGRYVGNPTMGTQPAVTKSTTVLPSLKGAITTLLGNSNYIFLKLNISGNQTITPTILPTDSTGVGITEFTNSLTSFTATVYVDDTAQINPIQDLKNRVIDELDIQWGSTTPKMQVYAPEVQFKTVSEAAENDIQTYTIEGIVIGNDIEIRFPGSIV